MSKKVGQVTSGSQPQSYLSSEQAGELVQEEEEWVEPHTMAPQQDSELLGQDSPQPTEEEFPPTVMDMALDDVIPRTLDEPPTLPVAPMTPRSQDVRTTQHTIEQGSRKPLFAQLPSDGDKQARQQPFLPSVEEEIVSQRKATTPATGIAVYSPDLDGSEQAWPAKTASPSEAWMRLARKPEDTEAAEQMLEWHSQPEKRYNTMRKLGEGGSGEVLLVYDRLLHRQVALKRLHRTEAHFTRRFIEEVRIVARLEHPNIVPLYDAGLDQGGRAFFTMKHVEGETLEDVILRLREGDPVAHHTYTFERRTRIFLHVLEAVRFAHQHNILHRDLKPSNVMLGRHGEVMVMDWGSAREEASLVNDNSSKPNDFQTQDGSLVGTPAYMSPEQALGKREHLDHRSDIYSLCVLFYEFLTLRHYLEHKRSVQEILFAIVSEESVAADIIHMPQQGNIPRNLSFFLKRGLQKEPSQRFQSIDDMTPKLERFLEGRIDIHCPSTLVKRIALDYARFLDTYRTTGVTLAIAMVVLFGIAIFQIGAWLGKI